MSTVRKKPGPPATMPERILLTMPEGMTAMIDAARGQEPRAAFIRRAIGAALSREPKARYHHENSNISEGGDT